MRWRSLAAAVLMLATVGCGDSTTSAPGSIDGRGDATPQVSVTAPPAPDDAGLPPDLRLGDEGEWVATLQRQLTGHGYPLDADGIFGPVTEAVVRDFQSAHGLTVDGAVGSSTWSALDDVPSVPSSTNVAEPSSAVVTLQDMLDQYEDRAIGGGFYTSYSIGPCGASRSFLADFASDPLDPNIPVGRGVVALCRISSEPIDEPGAMLIVVLDETGTTISDQATSGEWSEPFTAEPGLTCERFFDEPSLAGMETEPMLQAHAYTLALAYWFLEGEPSGMDIDGNGIPCEMLFPPDVVASVWAGDV